MARIRSIHPKELPVHSGENVRYLYAIGEEGSPEIVKIGRADHPLWRLSSLQAGNSRRLILLAAWVGPRQDIIALEATVHARFAASRVAFEWFRISVAVVEGFVEEVIR